MRLDDDRWQDLAPETAVYERVRRALFAAYLDAHAAQGIEGALGLSVRSLPFYDALSLVRVEADGIRVYAFLAPDCLHYVQGALTDIYQINLRHSPVLAESALVAEYLSLVLEIDRAGPPARWIEAPDQIAWQGGSRRRRGQVEREVEPLQITGPDETGRFEAIGVVQIAGALVGRSYILWPNGVVQKRSETVLVEDTRLAAPAGLVPFADLIGTRFAETPDPRAPDPLRRLNGTVDLPTQAAADAPVPSGPPGRKPRVAATPARLDELFQLLAGVLLDEAVVRRAAIERPGLARRRFFDHVRTFRPTIVVETPYRELRRDIARLFGDAIGLPLNTGLETGSEAGQGGFRTVPGNGAEIVLLTEASFDRAGESGTPDAWSMLEPIARGPHVALFVVESLARLPQDARDLVDIQLTIPRMGLELFWTCTQAILGNRVRKEGARIDWVQYLLPRDIARTAAGTTQVKQYLAELEQKITGRLARYTVPSVMTLAEVEGTGEARLALQEIAADIRDALDGKIDWDKVDRGLLLYGPPGSGKTTLVRALARECGIRFILASASEWQEAHSLGPHLQRIRDTFREARLYAPCILFIDEIDSLGSRDGVEERNNHYQTVVINTVLEELQGFAGRPGVIAVAATNNLDAVDPALRRPGRFDRTVEVPFPTVAALARIYRFYLDRLADEGFEIGAIDTLHLARLTFGGSGAHVEVHVRGAARRARRLGRRQITQQDLVDEVTNRPRDGAALTLDAEGMRRVAVHEAGHALVSLTGPAGGQEISLISIVPRADGCLGFVARAPEEQQYATRAQIEEQIRVMLGGRAAEEAVFGPEQISMGAGGSARSDLARATQYVLRLLTEFGLSQTGGLLWIDWESSGRRDAVTAEAVRNLPIGSDILAEARRTIDRLYAEAMERVVFHRAVLDRIVAILIDRQEITGEALHEVVDGIGPATAPGEA